MKKILGYKLKNVPVEKVEVPLGAEIFAAMDVNGEPTVFAVINPDELRTEVRTVYRLTTGKPFDDKIAEKGYIGSFTVANYGIVYHFYVGGDPQEVSAPNPDPVAVITEVVVPRP